MITPAEAKELKSRPEWQALEKHLAECIDVLDSCSSIADDKDFAVEAKARALAVQTIHQILEPFQYDPQPVANRRAESLRKLGM